MIYKFKNNTKIKMISLLSAVVLWLYVIEVVDPEERKLFENVPIVINNMNDLKEKDLVIYPDDTELVTDVYIFGKLSNIQKVKKENIHVYGQINNPKEGKNQIYLRASASERVTHEFKDTVMTVDLEKLVKEEKSIEIDVEGKSKSNVDKVIIDKGQDSINVSGPRVLVNDVKEVVGVLDVGSKTNDFSAKINLIPVDKDGNKVEGVDLEQKSVIVNVTLLKEKKVPIKVNFNEEDNSEVNLADYTLSQDTITIKGRKDIIDKIEYIETQPIKATDINSSAASDVYLNIPDGVIVDNKYINIKRNIAKLAKADFVYTPDEISIKNNESNIDISTIKLPESINVSIEYLENIGSITKSDVKLYIDLSQQVGEDKKYDIKYETEYDLKNVVINPNKTL